MNSPKPIPTFAMYMQSLLTAYVRSTKVECDDVSRLRIRAPVLYDDEDPTPVYVSPHDSDYDYVSPVTPDDDDYDPEAEAALEQQDQLEQCAQD